MAQDRLEDIIDDIPSRHCCVITYEAREEIAQAISKEYISRKEVVEILELMKYGIEFANPSMVVKNNWLREFNLRVSQAIKDIGGEG